MQDNLERTQLINLALETLSPREELVLRLRYRTGRNLTLNEIGKELGCSRERVAQIEAKALRKLRHPKRAALLLKGIVIS